VVFVVASVVEYGVGSYLAHVFGGGDFIECVCVEGGVQVRWREVECQCEEGVFDEFVVFAVFDDVVFVAFKKVA